MQIDKKNKESKETKKNDHRKIKKKSPKGYYWKFYINFFKKYYHNIKIIGIDASLVKDNDH